MKKITVVNAWRVFLSLTIFSICNQLHAQANWTRVPSPDVSATRNMLRGISGTSASDIWTVGSYEDVLTVPPFYRQNDLILHWNGSAWTQYPALNLSNTLDDLWDVEAIAPDNVWAVGVFNGATDPRAEIIHFDGTSWSTQNPPNITGGSGLFSMDALSANDIWAAGYKTSSPTRPAYVRHYNGSSWVEVNVPPVGLYRNEFAGIDAVSPTDVWAAGFSGEHSGDFHSLVMRWNGSSWQNIPLPGEFVDPLSEIINIKAISGNDVWVVGYYLAGGGFKLHWDGSSWTPSPSPNGGGGAFAAVAPDDVYSVGSEIWHWDGNAWMLNDPIADIQYPSLVNTVVLPSGEVWACGITTDTDNHFHTLVYRSGGPLAVAANDVSKSIVTIFPNPASDNVTVSFDGRRAEIVVCDLLGKVIESQSATETAMLNVVSYAAGTYLVRISGDGFSEVRKLVVSK